MTDDKLVEAVARAIAESISCNGNAYEWAEWVPEAVAAIAAVRQHMADDGK